MYNINNSKTIQKLYEILEKENINNNDISIIKIDYGEYTRYEILIRCNNYIRQFYNIVELWKYLKETIIPFKDFILKDYREIEI